MFVLDTNVVSELRKVRAGKANRGVADWASEVPSGQMFLSAVTVQELEHGVLLAERADPRKGTVLRRWLDESVASAFTGRILPVDEAVARSAAALHVPDPAPFRDALIGATALVHRMAVVTRNVKDFDRFDGLTVIDPWDRRAPRRPRASAGAGRWRPTAWGGVHEPAVAPDGADPAGNVEGG